MRYPLLCSGLLALLLASPRAQAQLSPDLIMESYNSNISAITNGAINKSVMESAMARSHAGRSAGRAGATARRAASARTAYTPTPALRQQTVRAYASRLQASNPAASQAIREGKLAAYQQGIGNLFKTQYGMDMSQFKLTGQGFAKK